MRDVTGLPRFVLATAACALVGVATANGFFLTARPVLAAVLPAILAALLLVSTAEAALAAAAGVAAGLAAAPLSFMEPAPGRWALAGATIAATVCAAGAATVLGQIVRRVGRRAPGALVALALAFLVLAMGSTARRVAAGPLSGRPPLVQALPIEPPAGRYWSDESIYARVLHLVDRGGGYYESVRTAWNDKGRAPGDPAGAFSFRLPTWFWMGAALPGGAASLVPAMLVFGTLAILAAHRLASRVVDPAFALVGATLVAVYYTRAASTSHLLQVEPWGAALTLCGAAAWASALTATGETARVRWTWAAAALCFTGMLFREHLAFVPFAALLVSASSAAERARRAWLPWALSLTTFGAVLTVHVLVAARHTSAAPLSVGRWFAPGTRHLVAAVAYGQDLLGGRPWLPWLLLVLALAGAARARPVALRRFLLAAALMPLVGFVLVRPPGALPDGGQPGYWGALVMPLLLATVPLVFSGPSARTAEPC